MTEQIEILHTFAALFIRKSFRERFMHEATKRPKDLHARICHGIETILAPRILSLKHSDHPHTFKDDDDCLFLGWSAPFMLISWRDAVGIMSTGGGGYLAIRTDGQAFYAETEGYPATIYACTVT